MYLIAERVHRVEVVTVVLGDLRWFPGGFLVWVIAVPGEDDAAPLPHGIGADLEPVLAALGGVGDAGVGAVGGPFPAVPWAHEVVTVYFAADAAVCSEV